MARSQPYTYGQDQTPDGPTDDNMLSVNTQPVRPTQGPAPYQPNDASRQPAPQPQARDAQAGQVAPPRTFSQMQAEGYARPPMPAPTQAPAPSMSGAAGGAQAPSSAATPDAMLAWAHGRGGMENATLDQSSSLWNAVNHTTDPATAASFAGATADPTLQASGAAGVQASNDNYAWGQTHGGFNRGDYNPNDTPERKAQLTAVNAQASAQNPNGDPMIAPPPSVTGAPGGSTAPAPYVAPSGAPPAVNASTPGAGNGGDVLSYLTGGVNGSGAGSAVQQATQRNALDLLNNPSPYGSKDVKDQYNWQAGNIDDQFALQRGSLGDEMAHRGLGNSSINAGRLNDLNIGQRSAKESMGQDLAHQYASSLGQYQQGAINTGNQVGTSAQNNQQSWLQQLMGYGQNAFNNDLATNQQNQTAQQNYQNYILQMLGLGYGS